MSNILFWGVRWQELPPYYFKVILISTKIFKNSPHPCWVIIFTVNSVFGNIHSDCFYLILPRDHHILPIIAQLSGKNYYFLFTSRLVFIKFVLTFFISLFIFACVFKINPSWDFTVHARQIYAASARQRAWTSSRPSCHPETSARSYGVQGKSAHVS